MGVAIKRVHLVPLKVKTLFELRKWLDAQRMKEDDGIGIRKKGGLARIDEFSGVLGFRWSSYCGLNIYYDF